MMMIVTIYRFTHLDGLACMETLLGVYEGRLPAIAETLARFAHPSAPYTIPAWSRVGDFLCCSTGDYFAIAHQPEEV